MSINKLTAFIAVKNNNNTQTNPISYQGVNSANINNKGLLTDTVSFKGISEDNKTPDAKMLAAVKKMLNEDIKLQPEQPLYITADKTHVPFLKILAEEAYKMGSGAVVIKIQEPELDALKAKYCTEPDWQCLEKQKNDLEEQGAAFVTFDETNSPYEISGLSKKETEKVIDKLDPKIPVELQKKLEIDPEEFFTLVSPLKKGRPIRIVAEREHENNVLRLAEYAYKNGSGPIMVNYTEPGSVLERAFYKYADEKLLTKAPQKLLDMWQEIADRKAARVFLKGADEEAFADIDSSRISKYGSIVNKAVKPIREQAPDDICPWNIQYIPTTMSAKSAYSDKEDAIASLDAAADDFKKINRYGMLKEHIETLERVSNKMNNFGFKEIHFVSVDKNSREPDGKTDLYVGLSDKSRFHAATLKTRDGSSYLPNTPTEEVFSSPDRTKTHGVVSATMPLSLNGKIVEGIKMSFEEGKIASVSADTNEEMLKEHIKNNENADMLGEVALVAGSPIFDTGRIFNSTLLDENAACHLAIGKGFDFCIEGASEIEDPKEKKKYLESVNMNDSTTHNDFMIGGPDVVVEGIYADGEKVTLIKDNKFQI